MRAEFLKVKASVIMQASQQPGAVEVHHEGAGSYVDTLKGPGPSPRPTILKVQSENARLAEEIRLASGRIRACQL